MIIDKVCEYFKIEENKNHSDSWDITSDHRFSQTFLIGKCTNEKSSKKTVSCYGMRELCQVRDVGGED